MSDTKPEAVNHPKHYNAHPARCGKCGRGIECIDVIEHLPCNTANAMKYIWRAGHKNDAIEDLRKAAWYIDREIERRTKWPCPAPTALTAGPATNSTNASA